MFSTERAKPKLFAALASSSLILWLGLPGGILAVLAPRPAPGQGPTAKGEDGARPVWRAILNDAPPEVQQFLVRVLEKVPHAGAGVAGFRFTDWQIAGRPTREALGLKAIPGLDPAKVIPRIMDYGGYPGNLAHVEACRSRPHPSFPPPTKARFYQAVRIPAVGRLQQVLVLVDAGTVKGYRLVYWYLHDETEALDPKDGARADYNVGAWLVAPNVVGFALSSCPRRNDVSTPAWFLLTKGANALAKGIVEGNIDGLAFWAEEMEGLQGDWKFAKEGRDEVEQGAVIAGSKATLYTLRDGRKKVEGELTFRVKTTTSPKGIDIFFGPEGGEAEGEPRPLPAIYRVQGDTLSICAARSVFGPDAMTRPGDFAAGEVIVLRRQGRSVPQQVASRQARPAPGSPPINKRSATGGGENQWSSYRTDRRVRRRATGPAWTLVDSPENDLATNAGAILVEPDGGDARRCPLTYVLTVSEKTRAQNLLLTLTGSTSMVEDVGWMRALAEEPVPPALTAGPSCCRRQPEDHRRLASSRCQSRIRGVDSSRELQAWPTGRRRRSSQC